MEEAIASSQLEGAVTTREHAKSMLRQERKPRNKSEQMILNNYNTIKKIKSLKNKITSDLILEIHASMTKDTLDDPGNEGKYR
ncbi:MAG: transposase, partial [Candidatus Methanoperedens sp.]|nr:transposase [Candidatus Methanoperedens sp.]